MENKSDKEDGEQGKLGHDEEGKLGHGERHYM